MKKEPEENKLYETGRKKKKKGGGIARDEKERDERSTWSSPVLPVNNVAASGPAADRTKTEPTLNYTAPPPPPVSKKGGKGACSFALLSLPRSEYSPRVRAMRHGLPLAESSHQSPSFALPSNENLQLNFSPSRSLASAFIVLPPPNR